MAYCAPVTEIDTSPLVLYGRRRSVARLKAGVLLLDQGRIRRRIPVSAIERVDVGGPRGCELTVVLTVGTPPAVTYVLRARSAPMVREFAAALSRALPVRGAEEPRPDGAALVTEEVVKRWSPSPAHWVATGLLMVYLLVPLVLWVAGRTTPFVLWLLGPWLALLGLGSVVGGWEAKEKVAALRTRGITVEGRLEYSYEERSGEDTVKKYVYSFADTSGEVHQRHGKQGGGAERVEIVYDPADPKENNKVGRGTAARLAGAWLLVVLLGVPAVVAGAAFMVVGVAALFP